jgi:DNA-binding NarL/FixJ family response regulator
MPPIRVLVVDDHGVVRRGLALVLAQDRELVVVGEAGDGAQAVHLARELCPDVVLMDLLMPVMDGVSAISALRRALPAARVLALTSALDEASLRGALRAGATGYLLKNADAGEVCRAIKAVAAGQAYLSGDVAIWLAAARGADETIERLSGRELEVLGLLGDGLSNQQIAAGLGIGENTVKTHVRNLLAKLGVESRTQAALYAARTGIIAASGRDG